ncbi:hypothetical protein NL676_038632 [Syzygium grande]|nr:hypothetical protein NL676_038632 [Syzygium grande]
MSSPSSSNLPLIAIPGGYGLPFFGAIKDRLDYFYHEGTDEFFRTRMEKYQSTVFRSNMVRALSWPRTLRSSCSLMPSASGPL